MTSFFFFFNDTATTEIYTLSLHDALPILTETSTVRSKHSHSQETFHEPLHFTPQPVRPAAGRRDRKSTRLNSSHSQISYAVFCLKKKKHTRTLHWHTPLLNDHAGSHAGTL